MSKMTLLALDLGTTKFCIAKPVWIEEGIPQRNLSSIEIVSVPARGMKRGMLSDFEEAKKALLSLVEKSEKIFNHTIPTVSVGIAGSHLSSQLLTKEFIFSKEKTYTENFALELERKTIYESSQTTAKTIIHAIPIKFKLDAREWIRDPSGFTFNKISIQFLIIEADTNYLKDVIRLCNQCGINIEKLIAEPYASASILACDESKERGVAICDIGGGTLDGIVFAQGAPQHVFTVNIGGRLFTKDISLGLGISDESADEYKMKADLNHIWQQGQTQNLTKTELLVLKILGSRSVELGKILKKELSPYFQDLMDGLVLTGGGSELSGLSRVLAKVLSKPVNALLPVIKMDLEAKSTNTRILEFSSKYATVCGILYLELKRKHSNIQESKNFFLLFKNNFFRWAKELS